MKDLLKARRHSGNGCKITKSVLCAVPAIMFNEKFLQLNGLGKKLIRLWTFVGEIGIAFENLTPFIHKVGEPTINCDTGHGKLHFLDAKPKLLGMGRQGARYNQPR